MIFRDDSDSRPTGGTVPTGTDCMMVGDTYRIRFSCGELAVEYNSNSLQFTNSLYFLASVLLPKATFTGLKYPLRAG